MKKGRAVKLAQSRTAKEWAKQTILKYPKGSVSDYSKSFFRIIKKHGIENARQAIESSLPDLAGLLTAFLLLISFAAGAQTFEAEHVSNNDGDTGRITVLMPGVDRYCDFESRTIKYRLFQCDTYEMKSKLWHERQKAKQAQLYVNRRLSSERFFIKYYGKDRYGRWLVRIYFHRSGRTLKDGLKGKKLLTGKYENAKSGTDICY